MGEVGPRDLNGQSIGSVMLDVDDADDHRTIKYAIRKRIPDVQLIGIRKMLDDKAPYGPVTGLVMAVDCLGFVHYMTAKLPSQFYRNDLHNVIDRWNEEAKTLIKEHKLGNTIYTKEEYESVQGRHLGESPVELF